MDDLRWMMTSGTVFSLTRVSLSAVRDLLDSLQTGSSIHWSFYSVKAELRSVNHEGGGTTVGHQLGFAPPSSHKGHIQMRVILTLIDGWQTLSDRSLSYLSKAQQLPVGDLQVFPVHL